MEGKTITINSNVLMFSVLIILLIVTLLQAVQINALSEPTVAAAVKSVAAPAQSAMVGGC